MDNNDKNENMEQQGNENSTQKKDVPLFFKIISVPLTFFLVAMSKEYVAELGFGKGILLSFFIIGAVIGVLFLLNWVWEKLKTWIKNR